MNAEQKERFLRFCIQKTNELINKYIIAEPSDKVKHIMHAIERMRYFDDNLKTELAQVLSAVVGESIPVHQAIYNSRDLIPGTVMIQISNELGNRYPNNVPLLRVPTSTGGSEKFLMPNGEVGARLDLHREYVRPATPDEIRRLTDAQLDFVNKNMIIL